MAAVGADDVQDDPRGVLGGWHFLGWLMIGMGLVNIVNSYLVNFGQFFNHARGITWYNGISNNKHQLQCEAPVR